MLGYEGDARASQEPRTSEDPIWNVFLDCTGHESKLENCRLKLTNDTCASVAALSCSRKNLEDKHALVIRVGDFNADYVEGSFEEEFAIEKVWIHEEYEAIHFQDNDIALIKIERKWGRGFRFNQRVQPVCLPSPEASFEDLRDCTVAGWGRTIIFSEPTRRPKELQVMVFPDTICEVYFGSFNYSSSLVCVGTDNPFERRPCGGDSGGALVCTVRNRKVLYAMLSSGPLCGILSFSPDVFTAITKYIRWIQERIAPFGYLRSGGELLDPYPYRGTFGDRDRWGGVLLCEFVPCSKGFTCIYRSNCFS
ncbi:granzyme M-like [Penaeus japonicus]|uniref:granzyme M-like n=1 Tax=Penaeus japonicus TaxID=27405 RepID=UPI001C70C11B|nr:granzyme M-like [Penaeus japonicus]